MEVILKKCKITSSILNQTLASSSLLDFKDWESLGWVVHAKEKWVIFYKEGELLKVLYNYSISYQDDWEQVKSKDGSWYRLKTYTVVIRRTQRNDFRIRFTVKEKAIEYIEEYNNMLKEAKNKGQFYI